MLRNSQWISLPCSFPIFPTAHENLAFATSLGNQFHRSAHSITKSNLLSFFLPSFLFLQISSDDAKFLALIVAVNIRSLLILSSSFMTCWTVLTSQLSHFFSRKCLTQLNWNVRIVEAGKYFKRSSCPASLPKATSKGCSEPCQVGFWTSARMESPQSQADFFTVFDHPCSKMFFLMFKRNALCFSFCSLPLWPFLGHHWEKPGFLFFTSSPIRCLYTRIQSPRSSHIQAEQSQLSWPLLVCFMP